MEAKYRVTRRVSRNEWEVEALDVSSGVWVDAETGRPPYRTAEEAQDACDSLDELRREHWCNTLALLGYRVTGVDAGNVYLSGNGEGVMCPLSGLSDFIAEMTPRN